MTVGCCSGLGEGLLLVRESSKMWIVRHEELDVQVGFWRHIEGLSGSMRTRTRWDAYDGEGHIVHFRRAKEVLAYAKEQALALAAARRLGYKGARIIVDIGEN